MKKFFLLILTIILSLSQIWVFAETPFNDPSAKLPYCDPPWTCSLEKWVDVVKGNIPSLVTDRPFSVYIQDVIKYLLTFVTLVAIIYIMYAWFKIFTSTWNEEGIKKWKNIIIYVLLWIVVIWLAYPLVKWIIDLVNLGQTTT